MSRLHLFTLLLPLLLLLSACYHLRIDAEPITPLTFTVKEDSPSALERIRRLVEDTWRQRILVTEEGGIAMITTPYHFATDTGFGQPPGGRKYYTQLRVEVRQLDDQTLVTISPYNYEIRTSYAYGEEGQVRTMYKHYPYEKYPGMFDLLPLTKELDRVASAMKSLFL